MDNARTIPEWLKYDFKQFAKKLPFYIKIGQSCNLCSTNNLYIESPLFIFDRLHNFTINCLHSGPNDNVFVYFADHGAPGLIAFPTEEVGPVGQYIYRIYSIRRPGAWKFSKRGAFI